jgi:hypothetical protein
MNSFMGIQRHTPETDDSPPSRDEVKIRGASSPILQSVVHSTRKLYLYLTTALSLSIGAD